MTQPKRRFKTKGPKPVDPEFIFWEHVERIDGACWKWHGATTGFGYGEFKSHQKRYSAHRFSYELHRGQIPHGMFVCHSCDNPACSNPDHLFLGTATDNAQDMVAKGRHAPPKLKGSDNGNAKLTESDIVAIRNDTRSQPSIAKDYGVSHVLIGFIKRRTAWKHVP